MPHDEARDAIGEMDEYVQYGTWYPPHDGFQPVHVAYVPLTSNRMQELSRQMDGQPAHRRMRASVEIIAKQVRAWTAKTLRGAPADCRNALQIGGEMDYNIVEGVAGVILDSKRSEEAQRELADFSKR
ncbi:MAG TPA: hypothetical protein P5137_04160 [Candidatus Brocadiia bacterium]|nr:hypothetical protein [Candidatus Brocadiia bacterium]